MEKIEIKADEQKNGVSIFEMNQSTGSWMRRSHSFNFVNEQFIFEEYVTNTLLSMGFFPDQIDKVLPDLNHTSTIDAIEQAIGLLTPEASAPVLAEKEEKEAIIRQKELHFKSKPIPSEQIINNNPDLKKMLQDLDYESNGDTIECIICMENKPIDQFWDSSLCRHNYDIVCLDCVYLYMKQNILEGKVEIFCLYPGCPLFIKEQHILKIIQKDPELVNKYHRFAKNLRQSMNSKIRWCPNQYCQDTTVILDKSDPLYQKELICKSCQTHFCAECGQLWHQNQTCQQAQTQRIQLCPSCRAGTVKNTACNRIRCHCGYEFCWNCKQQFDANHYKPWNIFKCPAAEYVDHEISTVGKIRRLFMATLTSITCIPCLCVGCFCQSRNPVLLQKVEKGMNLCIC